ncbi:S-adenosyl-L-methionine-dependent methyltransferase [Thozetella sp. PMI_491]|nr:S-adenosyl-L-methionine-dependent methyltransferase [Thozetella sp. PMI_491]
MDDSEITSGTVNEPLSPFPVSLRVDPKAEENWTETQTAELLASLDTSSDEERPRTFYKYQERESYFPSESSDRHHLELQHIIAKTVLGGELGLAPVGKPRHVLDLGTGTGIWAIEFAEHHPGSQVLGIDLSPIRPERIPDNCLFRIANIEDDWSQDETFDYVHGRYLCSHLRDFPSLFKSIHAHLKPGGWVEFHETLMHFQGIDGTIEGTALHRWNTLLLTGIQRMGLDAMAAVRYKQWMAEAGLVNVQERKFAVPLNPWALGEDEKRLGALQMTNVLDGLEGITTSVFARGLGWEAGRIQTLLAEVRRDIRDRNIHAYVPILVTWAQRGVTATS